jgi:lipopolysaccharide export LptBFGC system permease protein LptF
MPTPSPRQLLRRHAVAFSTSFVSLTVVLVANYAAKRLPELTASGAPTRTIVELVLLAIPFTAAMTIPMAVFVAVLYVFTLLGKEGLLAAARRERHGVRRLLAPVLGAATAVAALSFVWNSQIVPRANERLAAMSASGARERGDRELTIGELQAAARSARADAGPDASVRVAYYEVEIHKKYALAGACVVLALTGAALAFMFPIGAVLQIGASCAVFSAYYACLVAGESLADRLLLSPFVAMWMANAGFLAFALLVVWWQSRSPGTPHPVEPLAIGG